MYPYNYSLIIPHYNIPHLLERLLKTVPQRDDLQIIVVDDCSPEDSQEKLKLIQEKYHNVEFYSTGINGGGGKARNVGLRHAYGKYVLFADADDYFEKNFVELLDRYSNQEFDIIYFSAIFEGEDSNLRNYDNYIHRFISKALISKSEKDLKYKFTQPWGKFIKRDLVSSNEILFEESIVSNDVHFSTMTDFYAKKIIADPLQSYVWKIRTTSTSRKLNPQKILKRLEIDLTRHNFLKSIQWKDRLNYLEMLNEIDSLGDKKIEKSAMRLCKYYRISKREILLVRLKRQIRTLIK